MSSSSLPPLRLDFARAPARDALCVLTLMVSTATPALAVVAYGAMVAAMAALVGAAAGVYVHWRAGWVGRKYRVSSAVWDSEGQWWLSLCGRPPIAARLSAESVAQPLGAWLVFHTGEGRRFLFVRARTFPDSYRRLLVRLRIRGVHAPIAVAQATSDTAHIPTDLPLTTPNFRRAGRSTKALMELPWPRPNRGETRRP